MRTTSAVAVLLVALLATSVVFAADAAPEFKKMKIKAIREWLDDRGLACGDCQEKNDFVRFANDNAKAPILPSRVKVEPTGPFWDTWADLARDTCLEFSKKFGNDEETTTKVCQAIRTATDSVFMQHGKRTAAKLKKKPADLLKTSLGDTYLKAGRRLFAKLSKHCLAESNVATCVSSSKVQSLLESKKVKGVDMLTWITNVGIENTNPMYEILKEKANRDEL